MQLPCNGLVDGCCLLVSALSVGVGGVVCVWVCVGVVVRCVFVCVGGCTGVSVCTGVKVMRGNTSPGASCWQLLSDMCIHTSSTPQHSAEPLTTACGGDQNH